MAKKRHTTPEPTSNRGTMAIMAAGGVLVGALVVWALTRTVEPASVMTDATTAAPATSPATPPSTLPSTATSTSAPSLPAAGQTTAAPAPASQGDRSTVQRIAVEDLRAKMGRNEVTLLDVRDAAAFNARRIPGSINVPFASVEAMLDQIPKDKPIVTYCT